MYHFVALLWNAENSSAREQAAHLSKRLRLSTVRCDYQFCTDGLSVFALQPSDASLRVYVLPLSTGIVLGRLFTGDSSSAAFVRQGQFDEFAAQEIARTSGEYLLRNFWGGYVALLRDGRRGHAYVIRDCSGKIPCYYMQSGEVTIAFSDLNDLEPLGLPAFTINWEYLAAFIYSSQMQIRACAFKEIREILAGECLRVIGTDARQATLWDPRAVYGRRRIDDYGEAVAELRDVTQRCIDAWAATYSPILHGLSGGFDSAVVLGCLRNSPNPPEVTCLNQFTAEDDERRYARAAAERAGLALLEIPMDSAADRFDSRLLSAPKTPKPAVPGLFRLLESELLNRIATIAGAHTLWTGQGGDHIFLQTSDPSAAGDYFRDWGFRLGLFAAVADAAHLSRLPYWIVLKSAWSSRRRSSLPGHSGRQAHFVKPGALPGDVDDYVLHPWATGGQGAPNGKRMQIRLLAEVTNRHRPIPRLERAPQHHPLLSQPLMELCLQIPTYLLIRGGHDRALAREAFADRVPWQIIQRHDKGSIVSHTTEMMRRSEEFVRDLLLHGVLADAGVIRSADLEPYIIHGQPFREDHFLPLLACLAAELWVRTCTDSAVAVAA